LKKGDLRGFKKPPSGENLWQTLYYPESIANPALGCKYGLSTIKLEKSMLALAFDFEP
jgi:hypothetical protein